MEKIKTKNFNKDLKEWGTKAIETASDLKDKALVAKNEGLDYIDNNPRKAAIMAAGIGAAVGAVVALVLGGKRR